MEPVLSVAFTFFVLADVVGNAPLILALVHSYSSQKQKIILMREGVLAFILALVFILGGEAFLGQLEIQPYTVNFGGGIILFLVALPMIFGHTAHLEKEKEKQEPFLVPIATPLLAGPALLTYIILSLHEEGMTPGLVTLALVIAWIPVMIVLFYSPILLRLLGKAGMQVLEQLMGMLLCLIAINLILRAATEFFQII